MGGRQHAEGVSPRALARLRDGARPASAGHPGAPAGQFVPGPGDLVGQVRAPAAPDPEGPEVPAAPGRHRRQRPPRARWVRLPSALDGARWNPGRAAVAGVVGVALLAAAVLGVRVAWARASAEPVLIAPGGGPRAGPTGLSTAAAAVGVPTTTPSAVPGAGGGQGRVDGVPVVVHVVGQVRRPGVLHLPPGSRVADALEAAGGATGKADLGGVNLARVLVDGEQVRVPRPGEVVLGAAGPGGGGAGPPGALVPLNSADLATLDALPGVGPVLAGRIVDWRTVHGRFTTVDELAEVSGIGEKLLERLRPLVTT